MSNYDHFWNQIFLFRFFFLLGFVGYTCRRYVFLSSSPFLMAPKMARLIIIVEDNFVLSGMPHQEVSFLRGTVTSGRKREEFFGTAQLSQIEVHTQVPKK